MIEVYAGTRPEMIKLAPVVLELGRLGARVSLVRSGQHDELLDQAARAFDLKFDAAVADYAQGRGLLRLASDMLLGLQRHWDTNGTPQCVVVQGDTMTVFQVALAAYLSMVPVAHVEAGLRTGDLDCPFPEEGLRQMVARIAALHFAPTPAAVDNLRRENLSGDGVWMTGNTVVDALRMCRAKAHWPKALAPMDGYVLVTAHRRENWFGAIHRLCGVLEGMAGDGVSIVALPHPNPIVRQAFAGLSRVSGAHILESVPYLEMVALMEGAAVVVTDSGGVSEESAALGKPVVIFREKTERMEAVEAGVARLEFDGGKVRQSVRDALDGRWRPEPSAAFGDGDAARQIAHVLRRRYE